jgi:hypothetical protein
MLRIESRSTRIKTSPNATLSTNISHGSCRNGYTVVKGGSCVMKLRWTMQRNRWQCACIQVRYKLVNCWEKNALKFHCPTYRLSLCLSVCLSVYLSVCIMYVCTYKTNQDSLNTWSVRKVSDLWPGKRNWLTWSVGHLIILKVVPLGLHTLLPAVPPLLEACRKSLFRNGV